MVNEYLKVYADSLRDALLTVDEEQIKAVYGVLRKAYVFDKNVFTCGNGGSAAISQHFLCDHSKGVCADTGLNPKVQCLSSNMPIITAIANDIGYEEVFSYQLQIKGGLGDVLVAISSSGNSPNIIRALETAKEKEMITVALVGFDGGKASKLADYVLHVKEDNYGIVEDAHQSLMHILAQYIRLSDLNKNIDDIKL